jgi:hypothetical protein
MKNLLANRISVVLAAALFVAATWMNTSLDNRAASTSLVLSQPAETAAQVAGLR